MTEGIALEVHNLGKRYIIGASVENNMIRARLEHMFRLPLRIIGKERSVINDFNDNSSKELWALKNVSFKIKNGETVGIIGHNGAGKSALLKILSRITLPTEGWAKIYGSVASMLEVDSGFHPELTGRENIFMSGAILGMKKHYIHSKFNDIAELSELTKFLDTPVKRFSSGMRVRLAFAVAMQLRPDILIMDEILAVGDKSFREKCIHELKRFMQGNRTVLIVSHNISTIKELCSRIIHLEHGQIITDSSTLEYFMNVEN